MKNTLTAILILVSLVLSVSVFAQDATVIPDSADETKDRNNGDRGDNRNRGDRNRDLRVIDTDKDGQVSVDEYMTHAQQRFTDLDLDSNNFVTPEEAKEAAEIMRERQKEVHSDLNKRKQISQAGSGSE